jgi:hypothetical protein
MNPGVNPEGQATASFPTTHWSLINKVGRPESSQARAALEELRSVYWYPLIGSPTHRSRTLSGPAC